MGGGGEKSGGGKMRVYCICKNYMGICVYIFVKWKFVKPSYRRFSESN